MQTQLTMKKIIHLFCASLFLLVSCSENVVLEVNPVSEPFFASVEGTTRTYADENGKLLWTSNDKITLFRGNTLPLVYKFTGSTGDEQGGFIDISPTQNDFVTSYQLPTNYAIYPYAEGTTISNSGVINYTIPATQTYAENSFGLGANVMVAVTENKDDRNLEFKNVGGYFEFSLYGEDITVDKIEFSGNNGEKLAGDVSIAATHDGSPVIAFADDATTTLTLDCGEGVELGADAEHATKFWFVVPVMTYTKGITLTITDTYGRIMKKTTSKSITIERSTVQPLLAFDAEMVYIVPRNNQICYTSTDGEVVMPYKADVFGANIVSNVYENGRGVITFDGNVTSIGYNAFYDCFSLTSITIPNSVTSIGSYAFLGCSSLESITLPNSVTSIGYNPFERCSSLASFYGKYASDDNRCLIVDGELKSFAPAGLTSYTIPSSITSIGRHSFCFCTSLINLTIPDNVMSIGFQVFYGCSSLTNVEISNSVTEIGESAFCDCFELSSITLPDSITSIGDFAFYHCSSLASIILPNSVSSIGYQAFHSCRSLTTVYSKNITLPSARSGMFADCDLLTKIYVPYSSVGAYAEASGWREYADKIEGYDFSN